jgi:maleamate amidohydrolase
MAERLWDAFLTDQDRARVAASAPRPPYGFGRRGAVLSVDNCRGAVGDRPQPLLESIKTWPSSTGLAGWTALERIATLLATARVAGVPVIHTTGIPMEESGVRGWRSGGANRGGYPSGGTDSNALADVQERYSRRYDFVDQASPAPGEVVIRKNAPSAFFGTGLLAHLIGEGIDTLIVCGEAVSGCVRATVVDGCAYRLHMIVVEDCVYDQHEASLAINLFDIDQKYGDVVPLDAALSWLELQGSVMLRKPGSGRRRLR